MKFEDLEFKTHGIGGDATQARVDFDNGYGASVITGSMFYTSESHPYELAVFHGGHLTYTSGITDDVLGRLDKDEVMEYLAKIEALKE